MGFPRQEHWSGLPFPFPTQYYRVTYLPALMHKFTSCYKDVRTSLVAQMAKHPSTMWETRVQSLGLEDLLEKEMATHSSVLAWKIPWMEEPGRLQSMGLQRVGYD